MMNYYRHFINKEFSIKFYVFIVALFMIAMLLIIVILNKTSLNQYKNKEKNLINKITDLENKYSISQATIDVLNKKIADIEQVLQSVPHPPDLKTNQIDNLISHLKKDLINRNDLIPYQGVLGGTMGFYDENRIHILNHQWVYAYFEDGHIGGEMLLKYDISGDGKINWKVIASFP
jgi:hypothetical protein